VAIKRHSPFLGDGGGGRAVKAEVPVVPITLVGTRASISRCVLKSWGGDGGGGCQGEATAMPGCVGAAAVWGFLMSVAVEVGVPVVPITLVGTGA
jgi:hypothetical protein